MRTTITSASGLFGLVQKSVVQLVVRMIVDLWTNPKIRDANNDYKGQRIFELAQKPVVQLVVRMIVDFWTNPKIHHATTITSASGILDLSKNPLCN